MKNILILIGFIIVLTNCKDKKQEAKPYINMDENFKAYFVAGNVGSQYVYYDTVKKQYDTTVITKSEQGLGVYERPYESENYWIEHKCSNTYDYITEVKTYLADDKPRYSYTLNGGAASVGPVVDFINNKLIVCRFFI